MPTHKTGVAQAAEPVLCNGIPKSGTHILTRACEYYGAFSQHKHVSATNVRQVYNQHPKHLVITRDLRDALTSFIRHAKLPLNEDSLIYVFYNYYERHTFPEYVDNFLPWRKCDHILMVSFENIVYQKGYDLSKIAPYVGGIYSDADYEKIVGFPTSTYQADHVKWADVWSPAMDAIWNEYEMPRKNALWGYVDGREYYVS